MAGIYIHIPFCKQQCSYCDFHFSTTYAPYRDRMVDTICKELEDRKGYLNGKPVQTIYFGGGTPSLLTPSELSKLMEAVHSNFDVIDQPEVTLEANPDDITRESLGHWKERGVNRLSIGLQSFKEADLKWMNRAHSVEEAKHCLSLVREAGIDNVTVDLIYGLLDLTMEEWEEHINYVVDEKVPHISAYCLTVEPKTALHNWVKKGGMQEVSDDTQSEQFLKLLEILESKGYEQYEISNFSLPGYHSRHNSNYWKSEWYLGVGPSAHSFNGETRSWNVSNNQRYMVLLERGETHFAMEGLSLIDQFNEMVLTGLRTAYGVELDKLPISVTNLDEFNKQLHHFTEQKWIEKSGNKLILTKEGKLRADFIASQLFIDAEG